MKSRKSSSKSRKKVVQPVPVDHNGKPVFPIELGRLTVHSLGEVVHNRLDFHSENAIYPVGYVSTRVYGSLKDPTQKCIYTCKISDMNDLPRYVFLKEIILWTYINLFSVHKASVTFHFELKNNK